MGAAPYWNLSNSMACALGICCLNQSGAISPNVLQALHVRPWTVIDIRVLTSM